MRVALGILAGVALASGLGMGVGRPPSVDMVSARYSDSLPNPTHLGHWAAPVDGKPVFITANMMEAGTGAGTVKFGVLVVGTGVVCELEAPCTSTSASFPTIACPDSVAAFGAEVHLEFSHTCTTAPLGNVVFGFEWAR